MKTNKAAVLPIMKLSTFLNHSISIDTKGPLNPASDGSHYTNVFVDPFSNYVVTVPTPKSNGHSALNA